MFIYSSVIYTEQNTHIFNPDIAVALGKGNAGTSEVGINGTSANVTASTYDFVDSSTSNVDSSANIGTHSNFTAQQAGPDLINDTLTEEDTKGYTLNDWVDSNTSDVDSHTGHGISSNFTAQKYTDTINDTLTENQTNAASTSFGNPTQSGSSYTSIGANQMYGQSFTSGSTAATVTQIVFYGRSSYGTINAKAVITNSSGYILTNGVSNLLGITSTAGWKTLTFATPPTISPSTSYTLMIVAASSSVRIYYSSATGGSEKIDTTNSYTTPTNPTDWTTGTHQYRIYANTTWASNYEMDYEIQWTNANYTSDNEQLCIRTGPLGVETLGVDVYDGSGWTNIISSLSANAWNNVSVSTYLTNSTITFRYKGGTESSDTVQTTWQIESALLHTWNNSNYEIDLEEQWGNVDYNEANEILCIYLSSHVGSESIWVDVWYNSAWNNVLTDLSVGWNNVSVSAYLISSTFNIRFKGSIETADTTQDSWEIDAALLNVWSSDVQDFVDNDISNVDSMADNGTHSNFTAQQYGPDGISDTLTEANTGVAIAKVGTDTSGTGNSLALSFSHALAAGSNRLVVVYAQAENGANIDVSGITYGGTAMSKAIDGVTSSSGYYILVEIWYLLEASLGSTGSKTVDITYSGSASSLEVNGFCAEYQNVKQAVPEATDSDGSTSSTTITNNVSPSTGAWVLSAVGCGQAGSYTHSSPQTEVLDYADTSSQFAVAELRGGNGETSESSTWSGSLFNRQYRVCASWTLASNYELDLEVQWTNADFNQTNEYLCLYGGTMGAEDIRVDVWNGSSWTNLFTDLSTGWNNVTVSSYLTSSTFTIRFKGSDETGDTTQDSWNIDATLLNVWTDTYDTYDYVLSVTSQKAYDQNITLTLYNYSNINRLSNCTLWFHDGTQSVQIKIINGVVTQSSGPIYALPAGSSRYIAVYVQQSSSGTSTLSIRLDAKTQNSIVYACLIELWVT